MTKIQSHTPFVYNLIFNKRKLNRNEIINWYLLTKIENNNEKPIYFYLFIINIKEN